MKKLMEQLARLDKKIIKESVHPDDIKELVAKLESGDIDYNQFKSELEGLEYTDYSMRQGEMGNPDMRDDMAWDRERGEWDDYDRLEKEYEDEDEDEDLYGESKCTNCPSLNEECVTNECGGDMPAALPKQDDQVSMTVNMSGSGSGGIKDILDILRNIESGEYNDDDDDDVMIIDDEPEFEEYANTPEEKYSTLRSIMKSGDDLHKSKGSYSDKPYHGDNPMTVKEKLESLYNFVKSR